MMFFWIQSPEFYSYQCDIHNGLPSHLVSERNAPMGEIVVLGMSLA